MDGAQGALAGIALFKGLSEAQLRAVEGLAVRKKFDRGQVVFLEGSVASGFYVVASGVVKVYKTSFEGKEQILHIFGPGEPFGEVAVFEGGLFPAHAMAVEPSELIFLEKDALKRLMSQDMTLTMNMIAALCRRLRDFARLVENLTLKETPARLAAYLLHVGELKGADEFELDVSKGLLANFLGTTRETLSRALTRLADMGCVRRDGRRIILTDRDELERVAEGETRPR